MTAMPVDDVATAVDLDVAAVAIILRQLWPAMSTTAAERHAATVVRVNVRYYGELDLVAAQKLTVLAATTTQQTDEVPDDFCVEVERTPGMFLRKWTEDMDRRPSPGRYADARWQPGGEIHQAQLRAGKLYVGAAKHGECTACVKEGRLRQAVYRLSDARDTYSRSSLCAACARKLIGTPVVVPKFASPEDAQAWLDAQGGSPQNFRADTRC